mmetsp:Transcript_13357/g.16843  ORF Transcript_13357/g.16843 Transcript_13357/m.16843 type:complete len:90 (-) Transcript_13357:542-811(-)
MVTAVRASGASKREESYAQSLRRRKDDDNQQQIKKINARRYEPINNNAVLPKTPAYNNDNPDRYLPALRPVIHQHHPPINHLLQPATLT